MRGVLALSLAAAACGGSSESTGQPDAPPAAIDAGAAIDAANTSADAGSAAAATLSIAPTKHDFGAVVVGDQPSQRFVVTAAGGPPSPKLKVGLTGDGAFQLGSFSTCDGTTLTDGASCLVYVVFSPAAAAPASARLDVDGDLAGEGMHLHVDLAGQGASVGALATAPRDLLFDDTAVNATSDAQTVTVTNDGDSATGVVSVAATGSDAASFVVSSDDCTGASLAGHATCTFQVAFNPRVGGDLGASVAVSAAPGGTATVGVSGHGFLPAHLSGDASHSFAPILVGQTERFDFAVKNDGEQASGPLDVSPTGDTGAFSVTDDCPATLAGGHSCTVTVAYAPMTAGDAHLIVEIAATPGGKVTLTASGTAAEAAVLTVPSQDGVVVTSDPAGIDCGATCEASYAVATEVKLTAVPAPGTSVRLWQGDCSGLDLCAAAAPTCTVVLEKSCTAGPVLDGAPDAGTKAAPDAGVTRNVMDAP